MIDRNRALTPEDLIRRYKLEDLRTDRKAIKTIDNALTDTNQIMENYVKTITSSLADIQEKTDNAIEQYFGNGTPSLDTYPTSEWNEEEFSNHLGDFFYDKDTGKIYRFMQDGDTYLWEEDNDESAKEALAIANAAKDTADSKRRVFIDEPFVPYDPGDIWWYQGEIYRATIGRKAEDKFVSSDWVNDLKYTDDTTANNAVAELNNFKQEVKNNYVTSTALTTSNDNITAIVKGVNAKVDEKSKIYNKEPIPPYSIGDLYINGSNVYLCTTARESGTYDKDDWTLQVNYGDYATKSELKVAENSINLEVSKKIDSEEATNQIETAKNDLQGKINTTEKTLSDTKADLQNQINTTNTSIENAKTELSKADNDLNIKTGNLEKRIDDTNDTLGKTNDDLTETQSNLNETKTDLQNQIDNTNKTLSNNYVSKADFEITSEGINAEVKKKIGSDEVVSSINQSPEKITLKSGRLVIDTEYFKLSEIGKITATGGQIGGFDINETVFQSPIYPASVNASGQVIKQKVPTQEEFNEIKQIMVNKTTPTQDQLDRLDYNGDGTIDISDLALAKGKLIYNVTSENPGHFVLSTQSTDNVLTLYDKDDLERIAIGERSINLFNPGLDSDTGNTKSSNLEAGAITFGNGTHALEAGVNYTGAFLNIRNMALTDNQVLFAGTDKDSTWFMLSCPVVATDFINNSSETKKKNISKCLINGLDIIKNTDIYEFNYKSEPDSRKKHIGFVIGEKYNYSEKITSQDNTGADLYSMISIAYKAIQEQQKEIEELKEKIKEMESDR